MPAASVTALSRNRDAIISFRTVHARLSVRYISTSPMTMSSPAFRVIGSPRHDDSLSCFFLRSVAHWRPGPCQSPTVMITSVVTALALYNTPVAACNRTFESIMLRCSIAVGDAWHSLRVNPHPSPIPPHHEGHRSQNKRLIRSVRHVPKCSEALHKRCARQLPPATTRIVQAVVFL